MSKHNHRTPLAQPTPAAQPAEPEVKIEAQTSVEPAIEPPKEEPVAAEEPAKVEAPAEEPKKVVVEPQKVAPIVKKPIEVKKPAAPTVNITSAEIMTGNVSDQNVFAKRRAMNAVNTQRSHLGDKLNKLFAEYRKRMSIPTKDREELKARIKILKDIVDTACPTNQLDLQTATEMVRIVFDNMMKDWGTIYTDSNIFALGDQLKGTAYELDKMVMFIEAIVAMIEAVHDKNRITISIERLGTVLKNPNVAIAIDRIRQNIDRRNGFIK